MTQIIHMMTTLPLWQIPTFPEEAGESYPLVISVFIFVLALLGLFGALIRYFVNTLREITDKLADAVGANTAGIHSQDVVLQAQTGILLEIKETVDGIAQKEQTKPLKQQAKRGLA